MNNRLPILIAAGTMSFSSIALANLAITEDIGIYAPCDNAQVEIIWDAPSTLRIGELSWIDPITPANSLTLWSTSEVSAGDSVILPGLFALGERIDFSFKVTGDTPDTFSTANPADWGQFVVDDSDPLNVLVDIEDIRVPNGDGPTNNASFRVVFSHPVPAPGSLALLGAGSVMMIRRRR
jgi:hypothetical protein